MEPRPPEIEDLPKRPEPLEADNEEPEPARVVSWVAPGLPRKRLVPGARGLIYAGVIPRAIAWLLDSVLIALTSLVVLGILIVLIVGSPQQGDPALSVIA